MIFRPGLAFPNSEAERTRRRSRCRMVETAKVPALARMARRSIAAFADHRVPHSAFQLLRRIDNLLGITAGPDGNLWFTDLDNGSIDSVTPTGQVTVYPLPVIPNCADSSECPLGYHR